MVYERQDGGPQFIAVQNDDANRLGITQSNIDRFLQIGRQLHETILSKWAV
jgi:hypothetical protein